MAMDGTDTRRNLWPGVVTAGRILKKFRIHDTRCHGWGGRIVHRFEDLWRKSYGIHTFCSVRKDLHMAAKAVAVCNYARMLSSFMAASVVQERDREEF